MIQKPRGCDSQLSRSLSKQEKKLYEVLETFFCDINWSEIETLFEKILETCLTTDEGPFSKGEARSNLWIMKKRILEVLMVSWEFVLETKRDDE